MGRNMQDFKKKQEEEKTKRLLEERNREKAEEKAARERVRQQIAMVTASVCMGRRLGSDGTIRMCSRHLV